MTLIPTDLIQAGGKVLHSEIHKPNFYLV